jgi:hypothetical protein
MEVGRQCPITFLYGNFFRGPEQSANDRGSMMAIQ